MKCINCKAPIVTFQRCMKNEKTGEILCLDCYKKLQEEGKVA